ncbi:MAG: hypothetical protein IPL61_14515 [Myxococcales bacterium]|nr:hypothetical protein [Myxococcales bacterium]
MSDALWRTISERYRAWAGIGLGDRRREPVLVALRTLAAELGHASPEALLAAAATPDGDVLRDRVIARISVGLTWFGRELGLLEPALDRAAAHCARAGVDQVAVWSAGCSTGEEPYTIAMALAARGVRPRVLATDISVDALAIAARGHYPRGALDALPERWRTTYLDAVDRDTVAIGARVRACVSFARHNLAADPAPPLGWPRFDLVVCRNVLIYFEPGEAPTIAARLAAAARSPTGLVVGAVEQTLVGAVVPPAPLVRSGAYPVVAAAAPPSDRSRSEAYPVAPVAAPPSSDRSRSGAYPVVAAAAPPSSDRSRSGAYPVVAAAAPPSSDRSRSGAYPVVAAAAPPSSDRSRASADPVVAPASALTGELDAEAYLRRGIAARHADQLEVAIAELRRSRFLAADRWLAPYLLGLCLEASARAVEAVEAYRHAVVVVGRGGRPGLPEVDRDAATLAATVAEACHARLAALGDRGRRSR